MPPPPDGTNMPMKKDPRMRKLEQQSTAPKIFDSADYEVQKQRAHDEKAKQALKEAAEKAPHLQAQVKTTPTA